MLDALTLDDSCRIILNFMASISAKGMVLQWSLLLLSILAETFLNFIEWHYIWNDKYNEKIVFWTWYDDDVICLYKGNTPQININYYINSFHPNLSFTQEIKHNNRLNFLDITVPKQDNRHKFNIFRKPIYTDQVINSHSNHPYSHKMAAFRSILNHLIRVPLSEENEEKE